MTLTLRREASEKEQAPDGEKVDSRINAPAGSDCPLPLDNQSMTFASLCKETQLQLTIAVPVSITSVFRAVTRMSRIYYVGRFTSPESLAAVALTGSVSNITGYSLVCELKCVCHDIDPCTIQLFSVHTLNISNISLMIEVLKICEICVCN